MENSTDDAARSTEPQDATNVPRYRDDVQGDGGEDPPNERAYIYGRAAPWDQENTFNETLLYDSVDFEQARIPMLWRHNDELMLGVWESASMGTDSLFVRGWTARETVRVLREEVRGTQLAISFNFPDMHQRIVNSRVQREIFTNDAHTERSYAPIVVRKESGAAIHEISMVPCDAFNGTWWKVEGE